MSLRLSLGAGRGRLIQQVLVESALVAAAACLIGALFASFVAPAVVGLLGSPEDPVLLELLVDWRLVAFIGALTLLITTAFGLAPALRASNVAPMTALKAGGGRVSVRLGAVRPFVVLQVAFSLDRSLRRRPARACRSSGVTSVNPGFATSGRAAAVVGSRLVASTGHSGAPRSSRCSIGCATCLASRPSARPVRRARPGLAPRASVCPAPRDEAIEATMTPVTPGLLRDDADPAARGTDLRPRRSRDRTNHHDHRRRGVRDALLRPRARRRPPVDGRFDQEGTMPEVVGVVADARYDVRQPRRRRSTFCCRERASARCTCARRAISTAIVARLRDEAACRDAALPRDDGDVAEHCHHAYAAARTAARAARRLLRDGRRRAHGGRAVRDVELCGRAADARDWHPHRARRARLRCRAHRAERTPPDRR